MDTLKLAEILFPDVTETVDDLYARFPERNLPEGAKVTRFAPSPTGFVHFGSLFPVMVGRTLASQSGGVFYLRIEDTDAKREVEGADMDILRSYAAFGITFDEGLRLDGSEAGAYGPYRQSVRGPIYRVFAKKLVEEGKAYPCFCTEEELEAIRAEQEAAKLTPGYYGKWAKYRDFDDIDAIAAKVAAGEEYVLRFRAPDPSDNKIKFTDLIRGTVEFPENEMDHVLLKRDGIPTYHFAHAVDDTLMHTTHVIRGEEWLPSLPFHLQLFRAIGAKVPKYMHISQLMKMDGTSKKKLSKRDKGAGLSFYVSEGYPPESVKEYVMTLLNSNFEEWRTANPDAPLEAFPFSIKKMSASGCLFDFTKLCDVSKNVISRMSREKVYEDVLTWAKNYDPEFAAELSSDPDYALRVFGIGRGGAKPRKDIALWSEAKAYMGFFYDKYFTVDEEYPDKFDRADIKNVLLAFADAYDPAQSQDEWFAGIKAIGEKFGFCPDMKKYKAEPDAYKGSVADVSMFLRLAVTGRTSSPDMYEVMSVLGADAVKARLKAMAERI